MTHEETAQRGQMNTENYLGDSMQHGQMNGAGGSMEIEKQCEAPLVNFFNF